MHSRIGLSRRPGRTKHRASTAIRNTREAYVKKAAEAQKDESSRIRWEQANHALNLILPLIVIAGADAIAFYYGNVMADPEAVALMVGFHLSMM